MSGGLNETGPKITLDELTRITANKENVGKASQGAISDLIKGGPLDPDKKEANTEQTEEIIRSDLFATVRDKYQELFPGKPDPKEIGIKGSSKDGWTIFIDGKALDQKIQVNESTPPLQKEKDIAAALKGFFGKN